MRMRRVAAIVAAGGAAAGVAYLAYVAAAYRRYGQAATDPGGAAGGALVDAFMPTPEVAERHEVRVAAPAAVTFEAARHLDLRSSPAVRAIFAARELVLRAPGESARPREFVTEALSLGWGILAETPGREIVFGAVTQPWLGEVHFRALPPEQFAAFREPGWAKILWTLAADSLAVDRSVFRTETRVMTTDAASRERFRRYWATFSPGILLIRLEALRLVRADAERRARAGVRDPD